ncbi:dioxygenase [Nocardia sp. NBC_00403]|uniref:dioxygenase n=1 Tax=Nocardia sp. NBC_00403 TaxID=2975990 RepID=UPI002E20D732
MKVMSRRKALTFFGVAGAATVAAGCASTTTHTTAVGTASTTVAATGTASAIPQETAGPYPGDGSNGPNVLVESGVVRRDITGSFGSYSGVAHGVPMTLELTFQDLAKNGAAGDGMAVYLWHCDRDGKYSLYSDGVTTQNYLRGVQVADATGKVTFESVFPGCYSGRWTHIHFEVYDSLAVAVAGDNARLTSQIALPQDACAAVYAYDSGYAKSIPNLANTSLASDNVFGDGWDAELATVSGTPSSGMSVALTVGVAEKSQSTRSDNGPGRPPGGPGGPPPGGR